MSKVTALVVALMVFGLTAGAVGADDADAPKLGIRPVSQEGSYFTLELAAGGSQEITFEVGNFGAKKIRAVTYPADVYTLNNGGFGARLDGAPINGVTTWLDYEREESSLNPGQAVRRSIIVEVPKNTPPGQYITSLVVQNAKPVKGSGAIALDQVVRQAIAVAIDVPGRDKPALTIGDAEYAKQGVVVSVGVALTNSGNVHLKPKGDLVVRDAAGKSVLKAEVEMDSFYAGTSTSLLIGMTEPFAPGDYTLHITLGDEAMNLADQARELPFTVEPPAAETATQAQTSSVTIDVFEVTASRDSATQTVQFADTAVTITNAGADVTSARLTLHVSRDGQPVEDFVLASSMTLAWGQSQSHQRYIPAGGWTTGSYSFSLTLEQIDRNSGAATVLATAQASTTIEVS